jgi:toxin CptA
MRNAPSVTYPVGRCFFYAAGLVVLGALGLLVWLWWLGEVLAHRAPPFTPWTSAVGAVLWLAWAGFAWRSWVYAPVGVLQWDALAPSSQGPQRVGVWRWHRQAPGEHSNNPDRNNPNLSHGAPLQQVQRVLDLQSLLLLRVRNPDGAHRWLWVQRSSDPARWNDLRRALVQTA